MLNSLTDISIWCPEQGVGEAKGQWRGERVGYKPEPSLRCEKTLRVTLASVEAPPRSEGNGPSGEVATVKDIDILNEVLSWNKEQSAC